MSASLIRRWPISALVLVALAACSSGTTNPAEQAVLSLAANSPAPAPSAQLLFDLVNRGSADILFDGCTGRALDKRSGAAWVPIQPGVICAAVVAEPLRVPGHGRATVFYPMPLDVTPGTYRLRLAIGVEGGAAGFSDEVSAEFTVR